MKTKSDIITEYRRRFKQRVVDSLGGCCVMCQYSKLNDNLEVHHLDPDSKDFTISSAMANPKKWEYVVVELRKCVLVCNRCHKELHKGISILPENPTRFIESYSELPKKEKYSQDPCPVCGGKKIIGAITCSRQCAARKSRTVDWDNVDLQSLIDKYPNVKIGAMLGVSDVAVLKRIRKLGLKRQK